MSTVTATAVTALDDPRDVGGPRQPLLRSMPSGDPMQRTTEAPLSGDPPNPIDPPPGCRFHTRCAFAQPVCSQKMPAFVETAPDHGVACLRWQPGSGYAPTDEFPDMTEEPAAEAAHV